MKEIKVLEIKIITYFSLVVAYFSLVVSTTDQHSCRAFAVLIRSCHKALYISHYFTSPLTDN